MPVKQSRRQKMDNSFSVFSLSPIPSSPSWPRCRIISWKKKLTSNHSISMYSRNPFSTLPKMIRKWENTTECCHTARQLWQPISLERVCISLFDTFIQSLQITIYESVNFSHSWETERVLESGDVYVTRVTVQLSVCDHQPSSSTNIIYSFVISFWEMWGRYRDTIIVSEKKSQQVFSW